MIKIFEVEGNSLYPFLKNGQKIFCGRVFSFTKLTVGDYVVFTKKGYPTMIKRIEKILSGRYFLKGTDPYSIDSRNFGLVEKNEINYKKIL